jgi:peptide/nickel transport system permease protein
MWAALRRNRPIDHIIRVLAVSGVALPAFWAALLLQLIFSVHLGWLPTSGQLSVSTAPPPVWSGMILLDALLAGQFSVFAEAARYAVLPAFVLALPSIAAIVRVNRAEMIEVLGSDYVTAARAHGVRPLRVIGWLALKNAMLPTLAMIGLRLGWTLGSSFLVETVFDWPGIGLYAVSSAIASDFKPVMGVTLSIGVTFMVANLLIDLAYGWLDPRTRSA